MAKLEFEFVSVGAKSVDNELNNIKTSFSNVNGLLKDNIKDSIIYSNALKEVSSKLKQAGGSNEYLIKEQLELKGRLNDVNATIRQQIKDFDSVDGSLVQLRANLSLANKAYDNLSKTARQSNIGTQLGKQIQSLNQEISKAEQATGRFQRQVGNYEKAQGNANGVAMEFNRIIQDAPFGMMGIGNNIQQLAANWQNYTTQARDAAAANGTTVTTMGLVRGAMAAILSPANLLTLGIAAVTSAWTYYAMNTKTVKESTQELSNSFVSQLGTLNLLINSLDKGVKTQRDKASAVSMYNKELGDTLGKVKTYAELENKLIKNAPNYIQYLSLKARAEGAYQLSLEKTKKLLNDNISLSENKRVTGMQGWLVKNIQNPMDNFFDNAFKSFGAPDLSGLRTNDITPEEALAIAGLPSQKDFDKAIKYFSSSIQHGLVEMRKQNKTLKTTDDLFSDLTKKANEYADTLGLEMPDLGLDENSKSAKSLFDYLTKIKDLLGDKRKDLDMFGLKGEKKELKDLEYSFKDFFSELDKLSSKLSKDKSIGGALKKSIQGEIENAKKLGEELKELQGKEIESKWLEERNKLIDELEGKLNALGQSEIDKRLNNWTKEVDKFKEAIISSGVPLAQFQDFINEMTNKGKFQIISEFTTENINEWSKENDKIADAINKPFSGTSRRQLQKDLDNRLYDLKTNLEKQAELAKKIGLADKDFIPNIAEFTQEIKIKWEQEIETILKNEQAKKDIQDYVAIANNGLNSVFTNLKANIDEFGLKARSVFYTLGESLGDLIKQLANKNTAKFMQQLTDGAKDFKGLADNFSNMWKNDKGMVIGAGLSFVGSGVSQLSSQTSVGGQAVGGILSGAGSMASTGNPYLIAAGAVIGGLTGALNASKNKKQERIALKQLEEQKKANALLERMSALTYASQIIGQKTEYGIVSGMKRNEYGQIVSVVQGQDIIMVADRTNNGKNR